MLKYKTSDNEGSKRANESAFTNFYSNSKARNFVINSVITRPKFQSMHCGILASLRYYSKDEGRTVKIF